MATPSKKTHPASSRDRSALHKKVASGEDPGRDLKDLETTLQSAVVQSLVLPRDQVLTHLLLMWQQEFAIPDSGTVANAVAVLVADPKA